MFRLTKRLEVLIETRESIIAHPTSSSPLLQFWLIGVQSSFGTNFFPKRHLLKDCVHTWGSTSNLCTVNKENDAFQACQGRKTRLMFKEECVCDFRRIQQKMSATKAIDATSFDCWNSNIDQFCGIKWPSNKIPERTEVCVAVKWGALENEITASREKRVPGTFIMEIWQHLDSEKTNLPPY